MVFKLRKKKRGSLKRLLAVCITVGILLFGVHVSMERLFPMPYCDAVTAAAEENGISPALLYALMKAESNFDAEAVSKKGAKGLMQLMEETAVWCGKKTGLPAEDLLNPEENIPLGAYYLGYLLTLYDGEEECAVAAYNAGQGRVNTWLRDSRYSLDGKTLRDIPFPETERYVKKIRFYKGIYERKLS
ncbi:MAG: lytic transglycosylase domain-containing protein [Ruminococcaceae bacterium]|nr:lytic transglycosylase domain-containing protein [Oscillospiraceae bacterium]